MSPSLSRRHWLKLVVLSTTVVVDRRAREHRVARQHGIDARVERRFPAERRHLILLAQKRHVLPLGVSRDAQHADGFLRAAPHAPAVVVGVEPGVVHRLQRAAHLDARERTADERAIELRAGLLRAAERQRKRQAAPLADDVRPRDAHAVRQPVAVLADEDRHEHQVVKPAPFDDLHRAARRVRHLDPHRPLVDDEDHDDLRGVGDRREALEDGDVLELLRRLEPRRRVRDRRRPERRADREARDLHDLVVGRDVIAVDLNRGDDFLRGGRLHARAEREKPDAERAGGDERQHLSAPPAP